MNLFPCLSNPMLKSAAILVELLVLSATNSEAEMEVGDVVVVDFGTIAPVVGVNGNDFSDVVIADGTTELFGGSLIDSNGDEVTGVGFEVTNRSGQDTGRASGNNGVEGTGLLADSSVYSDWLISNDANGARLTDGDTVIDGSGDRGHLVLTFTGLDDSLTYNLTGGFDNDNDNFNAIWQADGQSFTTDGTGSLGYGSLAGLTSDGSGNLAINVIRAGDENGLHVTVAGLSLEAAAGQSTAFGLGDEVRVDFGTTPPSNPNYNVVNSGALAVPELVRFSDGVGAGVGLTVSASNPFDNAGNVASTAGLSRLNATESEVYEDGFLSTNGNNGPGTDTIVLTFVGLDDSLYYDLTGGLSRSSNESNFSTTWSHSGVDSQIADGTTEAGHIELKGLSSIGGTLVVTLTDNVRQSGLAQLSLVATDVPPPPSLRPAPELPANAEEVVVIFDATESDPAVSVADLDYMTIGGAWQASLPSVSQFKTDPNTGKVLYGLSGTSAQGDFVELNLDGVGLDFTAQEVAINFEMLATHSSSGGDQHATLIAYDGGDEIFRLEYVSHDSHGNNAITATSGDGAESMGFTPLGAIAETAIPSGLQDFRIVLSGNEVFFRGSSLTSQDGTVMNSAQKLTRLRWEVTGGSATNQGFWLDELRIQEGAPASPRPATERPNVIFMLTDDMGYSDISCYGATRVETTNLDSLAAGGLQITDFVLPGNVCSPTRASFLTGAYPSRCGIPMAVNHPNENHWFLGLDPDEITIAEQCRKRGYKTSMVGKWHLGVEQVFLPHNQGFDRYFGTWGNGGSVFDETEVIASSFPANRLTAMYTQRIKEQIREFRDRPFFLYYPHNYPHTPYTEGNAFDGSTGNGTRSDVLKELDWSVGQIVAELEANGLLENTLIIFTSDNGAVPPASYGNAPFSGSKYVTWEGGHRVPFIMYWKGQVLTPGVKDDPQVWAMDVFPTISELMDEPLASDRVYDGTSLVPLLSDQPLARELDAPFYYYNGDNLQCVRKGHWKLHLPRNEYQLPWWDQIKPPPSVYRLYDLDDDPGESRDLITNPMVVNSEPVDYSNIINELTALAVDIRLELGDADPNDGSLVVGSGQRGTGTLFPEVPTILNLESDYNYVPDWNSLSVEEKGRAVTRRNRVDAVAAGGSYLNGTLLPAGWQYLNSSEAVGGTEVALTPATMIGTEGNIGFVGSGATPAGVVGRASVGLDFVIDSANTGNGGVEGEDLLITMDGDAARDFVIVRYTVEELDVNFGRTRAEISGSFRDLVGGTDDDSVSVFVMHNGVQLFAAEGAAGRLSLANGSFALADLVVQAGDTIDFVVGSRGTRDGDEVALNAAIEFGRDSDPEEMSLSFPPQTIEGGSFAMLELEAILGLGYSVQRTSDLADLDSWTVVDELPFLPSSPFQIPVEVGGAQERLFWRVQFGE